MKDNARLLVRFMGESNRIEGIYKVTRKELTLFEAFLGLPEITIADLCNFVLICAGPRAVLRQTSGQDVYVGDHTPPPGGPDIPYALQTILDKVNNAEGNYSEGLRDPYVIHHAYESLHPFMDGNGRSGRALWAWQMLNAPHKPDIEAALGLGFLHRFYYQALSARG